MLLAPGHGFEAASVNYGGAPRNAEALQKACPIVGSYGGRDRSQRGAAASLKAILDAAGVDNDVKEYPVAGHSFLNNHPGTLAVLRGAAGPDATLPRFFAMFSIVAGPLIGMGYKPDAAADARGRILAFFDHHLK